MRNSKSLGAHAEKIARAYLLRSGYTVLHTNFRVGHDEIDIIARIASILVFIEVKARSNASFGFPESAVDDRQQQAICRAAEEYMEQRAWNGPIRFDIISLEWHGNAHSLRHFEDAFY